ncbi:MAG: hypothetical protein JNL42_02955 [Anaerolineae bacterium]|nr:hypothetical protein [Anaerolineae bacterium]
MASIPLYNPIQVSRLVSETREILFAGDHVRLSGQLDLPTTPAPRDGYPLLFILPHASSISRDDFDEYAATALRTGFAVFRWDKRGTGRSGSGGRGSSTQDAINAYETALLHEEINRRQAIILAVGAGTGMLGNAYGLFARLQRPAGALLIANQLSPEEILAIDTEIHILMSQEDWNAPEVYGSAAAIAHRQTYSYGAGFTLVSDCSRFLMTEYADGTSLLHEDARRVIAAWLRR